MQSKWNSIKIIKKCLIEISKILMLILWKKKLSFKSYKAKKYFKLNNIIFNILNQSCGVQYSSTANLLLGFKEIKYKSLQTLKILKLLNEIKKVLKIFSKISIK